MKRAFLKQEEVKRTAVEGDKEKGDKENHTGAVSFLALSGLFIVVVNLVKGFGFLSTSCWSGCGTSLGKEGLLKVKSGSGP